MWSLPMSVQLTTNPSENQDLFLGVCVGNGTFGVA